MDSKATLATLEAKRVIFLVLLAFTGSFVFNGIDYLISNKDFSNLFNLYYPPKFILITASNLSALMGIAVAIYITFLVSFSSDSIKNIYSIERDMQFDMTFRYIVLSMITFSIVGLYACIVVGISSPIDRGDVAKTSDIFVYIIIYFISNIMFKFPLYGKDSVSRIGRKIENAVGDISNQQLLMVQKLPSSGDKINTNVFNFEGYSRGIKMDSPRLIPRWRQYFRTPVILLIFFLTVPLFITFSILVISGVKIDVYLTIITLLSVLGIILVIENAISIGYFLRIIKIRGEVGRGVLIFKILERYNLIFILLAFLSYMEVKIIALTSYQEEVTVIWLFVINILLFLTSAAIVSHFSKFQSQSRWLRYYMIKYELRMCFHESQRINQFLNNDKKLFKI